jgi:hypothetical protein
MTSIAAMARCARCLAPFTPGLSVTRCNACFRRAQDAQVAAAERRAGSEVHITHARLVETEVFRKRRRRQS